KAKMRVFGVLAVVLVSIGVTVSAQSFEAFGFKPPSELIAPAFGDEEVAGFMRTLDRLLAADPGQASWSDQAAPALRQFARRLQTGRLSSAQEARVLDHLDRIAASRAEAPA